MTDKQLEKKRPELTAGNKIMGLIPRTPEEAGRIVDGMFHSGMTPDSYIVKENVPVTNEKGHTINQERISEKATKARLLIGIMKGLEVGLPPITALSTICVINNRPCLWGDGAVALVQKSGKVEYIKSYYEGDDDTKEDYTAHYIVKRKDQDEEYHRTFSMGDAKRARLLGKKGPWAYGYAKRMLMMRAQAWALRDACSDLLMGIGIAEEVRDFENVEDKRDEINTSSLDDDFTPQIENTSQDDEFIGINLPKEEGEKTVEHVVVHGNPTGDNRFEETIISDHKQGSLLGDADEQ